MNSPKKESFNGRQENGHVHEEKKVMVRYKECLKNHAAAIGGNAVDGCGEFMPSGEEGSIDALKCSACNCHRNFHRKETEGLAETRLLLGYPTNNLLVPSRPILQQPQMVFSPNTCSEPSESDEKLDHEEQGGSIPFRPVADGNQKSAEKRFRTKFSEEQKGKMAKFAEKAGWKMQKLEECVVQQFCQEIGIKRRVLKVWMHNNKHKYVKENGSNN